MIRALTSGMTTDEHFRELKAKHRYEQDLYWTHQLFTPKWSSGLSQIEDEIPV
jgi:hypothetical protein